MTNTFDGTLGEFPFIGIDKFDSSASVFLLTHCHSDHLVGINNKSVTGQIYCSQETKELIKISRASLKSLALITTLSFNTRTRLDVPQLVENVYGQVYVTLIRANHCVGLSMYLVENSNGAVLVTGDLRAEKWWCDGLRNNLQLYPYLTGHQTLDNIYFDATFGYRGEPYIEIPANNAGIHAAICLLKEYPRNDPEISFTFVDTVLGFEQAWAFILSYFGGALHIADENLEAAIRLVVKYDEVNGPALSRALQRGLAASTPKGGIFHAGGAKTKTEGEMPIAVRIKQCINFNIMDLAGVFMPLLLSSMTKDEQEAIVLVRETKMGHKLIRFRERLWILPKSGNELLPTDIKLVFSRHSSYSEVHHFVSMFKPKQVYPCWFSEQAWRDGFSMQRLFGNCCSGDQFQFDRLMLAQRGPITSEIFNTHVATIDRWSVDSCKEEEKAVEQILENTRHLQHQGVPENKIALINLRRVVRIPVFKQDRSKEDHEFLQKRNGLLQLQALVQGRRDISFRKFIESQQMLYYKRHNLPQYEQRLESRGFPRGFDVTLGGISDSGSDTGSSSLDLAEIATRSTSPAEEIQNCSVVSESQHSVPWDFPSPVKGSQPKLQRSFVRSSFESFEESLPCKRARSQKTCLLQSLYFLSENPADPNFVKKWTTELLVDPNMWGTFKLQCTRPKVT